MIKEIFDTSFLKIKIKYFFKLKKFVILIIYSTLKLDKFYLKLWIKKFFQHNIKICSRIKQKKNYYYKIIL